jgi:hypothetical protein
MAGDIRTFLCEHWGQVVHKRDRFVAEIRSEAKERGLAFRYLPGRGKGGHALLFVGDRLTTLPSREIDPRTAAKIRRQLGLA